MANRLPDLILRELSGTVMGLIVKNTTIGKKKYFKSMLSKVKT
jgi:hypothetical protein